MEKESFEDKEVAEALNHDFISIKVDKEERPDIDGVYMQICQSVTGSGGWPLTIIMTPEQKPFYAGTYLPKHARRGMYGLMELLSVVSQKWENDSTGLMDSADEITQQVKAHTEKRYSQPYAKIGQQDDVIIETVIKTFKSTFDKKNGGFGRAPKFPSPHNLLFLMRYHQVVSDSGTTPVTPDASVLPMVEKTLTQMYKGGLFDHIGYGFSRYSTDERWLAPHFEKMLYDNALLIMAYVRGYEITGNTLYKEVTQKTIQYVLNELTAPEGAFYCAQDADSDGEEGKYYVWEPSEVFDCLGGDDGEQFCHFFGITAQGNFEGKNIPNRLHHEQLNDSLDALLPVVYAYRKQRATLHRDDKVLTSWNALMIAALAMASRILDQHSYLEDAERALRFVEHYLTDEAGVYTSYRDGKRSEHGFLDDYAFLLYAYLEMYQTSLNTEYLHLARLLNKKTVKAFFDRENGGFYINKQEQESLVLKLKEVYDGAIPSGNAVMAYNIITLAALSENEDEWLSEIINTHYGFMTRHAAVYPAGHCFYGLALLMRDHPPAHIVCVLSPEADWEDIRRSLPRTVLVTVLTEPTTDYPLLNSKTTYYVCDNHQCSPPVNEIPAMG